MIGTTLGRYRIESVLGAGGMGVVYRAYDTELARPVAIKVLASDLNQDNRRRLIREARSASALNHPHICTVHEVGEADGRAFLVMEFVEGRVLRDLIPAGGLPSDAVIRYGTQIAAALAHAHDRSIVHRDLKTANVVANENGRVKVLDFGIAERLPGAPEEITESHPSLSMPGAAVGTLAYMAPELLQGVPGDARSDIWALGVVLYEMATGKAPFQGSTSFELVSAILRDAVPPLPASVPAGLASVIQRCLAREPGRRYQRASEVESALEPLAQSATGGQFTTAAPRSVRRRWILVVAAAASLVCAGLVVANVPAVRDRLLGRSAAASAVRSLAVIPLNNLSGDAGQDYFADGMTESLISSLAQIRALKVISRTSAMRYKGTSKSLPEIAHELNVDAIIEGSVQYASNRVRVSAQLIDASDTHLWAREYERDAADVLKLQSDVARAIADEIRIQLTPQEQTTLARTQSINPAAYDAYLRGRYHYWRFNEADLKEAIDQFERAIQIEPRYAAAYAGLSQAWNERGVWGSLPYPETELPQREAARKALELDPTLSAAHAAWANVKCTRDWDWGTAEAEFSRALELDPGNLEARHLYATLFMALGRHANAIAEMERAEMIDPMSSVIQSTFGRVLYRARRYDDAITHLQRAIDLDRNNFGAYGRLGDVYEAQGKLDDAIAMNQKADQLRQGGMAVRYSSALARLFARTGRRHEALAMMDTITREPEAVARATVIASAYASLGDKDRAFSWLNRGIDARVLIIFIKTEPQLDSLHDDPRWPVVLRRMNMTP